MVYGITHIYLISTLLIIGWEPDSWGYHGDDGHSFCCSGTGKPYGPMFTTGDTIGCCLNFRDGTAFYTKNGKHLGKNLLQIKYMIREIFINL